MAEQKLRGARGFAPLRVERSFQAIDKGRGSRAAALSESLGVILQAAPQIAERESAKAFEAGVKARIDGVQAENAAASNKSLLGFMFSKRAQDGFDYQDAQLELPVLQAEEMMAMDALRNSRNPEDFRAYIAQRDEALRERFSGRSDIYRYTVAEAMQKTRGDQAKLFTNWVQSNREKDRRAAAAASARAAAAAKAARMEAAAVGAVAGIEDNEGQFSDTEFSDFVTNAEERYGITAAEAKDLYVNEVINEANRTNNESLLTGIDPKYLTAEQRETLNKATDTIRGQRIAVEDYEYKIGQRESARAEEQSIMEANTALREATLSGASPREITARALDTPLGQSDPQRALAMAATYTGINDALVDPTQEAMIIEDLRVQAENAAVSGDFTTLDRQIQALIENNSVRSGTVSQLYSIRGQAQAATDEMVREHITDYEAILTADFQPESVTAGEPTPLAALSGQAQTYHREVSQRAHQEFNRRFLARIERHIEQEGVNVRNIPEAVLNNFAASSYEATLRSIQASEDYKKLVAEYNASTVSEPAPAREALGDPQVEGGRNYISPAESMAALREKLRGN